MSFTDAQNTTKEEFAGQQKTSIQETKLHASILQGINDSTHFLNLSQIQSRFSVQLLPFTSGKGC